VCIYIARRAGFAGRLLGGGGGGGGGSRVAHPKWGWLGEGGRERMCLDGVRGRGKGRGGEGGGGGGGGSRVCGLGGVVLGGR